MKKSISIVLFFILLLSYTSFCNEDEVLASLDELKGQLGQIQSQLSSLQTDQGRNKSEIDNLRSVISKLETDSSEMKSSISNKSNTKPTQVIQSFPKSNDDLSYLKKSIALLSDQINTVIQEIDALKLRLNKKPDNPQVIISLTRLFKNKRPNPNDRWFVFDNSTDSGFTKNTFFYGDVNISFSFFIGNKAPENQKKNDPLISRKINLSIHIPGHYLITKTIINPTIGTPSFFSPTVRIEFPSSNDSAYIKLNQAKVILNSIADNAVSGEASFVFENSKTREILNISIDNFKVLKK
ncbi:MAG: hypothetical protein ABIA04_10520 [Pseudomonadota bacterium]